MRNLTPAETQELCNIMSKGNTLLKECAEMMGLQYTEFRGKLFNKTLDTKNLSVEQLAKLTDSIPSILEVRERCERRILDGFNALVMKQSQAAAANHFDPNNAYQEFYAEGRAGLLDSIYGYTDTKVKLMTYIWRCVRRRIVDSINRLNPLCPLTNEALNLVRRFEQQKVKLNRPVTDSEVVEAMGLTPDEQVVLFSATTKVINEALASDNDNEEIHDDDYTASRRSVDRDVKEVSIIRKDARQALKDAELDSVELAVLLADMFPYHGWKEDIAANHLNARTGKRFTRQNVQYVLERAKKKVREAYLFPPKVHREDPSIDKFFDEMDGKVEV